MCQELADLGMQLARAAAKRALHEAEQPADQPRRKTPDPNLAFTRVSREVRQIIALEIRLTAGPAATRARPSQPRASAPKTTSPAKLQPPSPAYTDDRREALHQAFEYLTREHPKRDSLRGDFAAFVTLRLLNDKAGRNSASTLLIDIGKHLGLDFDGAAIPEEIYQALRLSRHRTPEPEPPIWIPPVATSATGPPQTIAA